MNRRGRRDTNSKENIGMIVWSAIIVLAVIAFIGAYLLYSRRLDNQAISIAKNNNQKTSSVTENTMINMVENTEEASSSIGKSVNQLESQSQSEQNTQNTEKIAINTSNLEKKQEESKQEKNQVEKAETTEKNSNTEEKTKEKVVKDPNFANPVEGEKIKDYSKDNLIYSNTLDEWTTHLGIDFAAEKTDIVKASANGKVKSIKNDPRYGLTVVIEHDNGFESIYSSLLTAEFINVGEEVKQGQTIATVGNTARFEIADQTHLHFEIKKDGENVDPNIYLK